MFEVISLTLSVMVGVFIVLIIKPKQQITKYLLTFSGAYLLSITVIHLMPEVFEKTDSFNSGLFVLMGLLFQLILDYFSKGIDHGHIYHHALQSFPWALFISLNIHAFMEGVAVSDHHHDHLLWAIIVHKVPIAMVLAVFLIFLNIKRYLSIIFLIVFALMSPLGVVLGDSMSYMVIYQTPINAFIAGMFLHISTTILSETSDDHKFKWMKFVMIIIGVLLAVI